MLGFDICPILNPSIFIFNSTFSVYFPLQHQTKLKIWHQIWTFENNRPHLAVCCRRAFRKVSGWKSSDKSNVSFSSRPDSTFSTQVWMAIARFTRPRRYASGSSGPSHFSNQLMGVWKTDCRIVLLSTK